MCVCVLGTNNCHAFALQKSNRKMKEESNKPICSSMVIQFQFNLIRFSGRISDRRRRMASWQIEVKEINVKEMKE